MKSFAPPKRVLMGPGPSDVPKRVLQALAKPTIGHLDPSFISLMEEIKLNLRKAFLTDNDFTLPISAPGTAAMEACISNLLEPGDTVVIGINGVFGGRLSEMSKRIGANVVAYEQEWGRALDPESLRTTLKKHPEAKLVAAVHAETSTGALSDIKTLAEVTHESNALFLVDAVTSLGGSPLKVDDWKVDAIYSGTQKCLSCPPGLAPISLSERALETIRQRQSPPTSWFLDFGLLLNYWGANAKRAYHHTAPINALYGLAESLDILHEEGLEQAWARHERLHDRLKTGLMELGLELVVPESERIHQLNAVRIPDPSKDQEIRAKLLEKYGLEIGAGLGPLAGKIWRIGLMGASCTEANVDLCLQALRESL